MKPKIFFLLLLSFYIVNCTLYIAYGTVRYVSKTGSSTPPYISWQTAADSIQKAINVCIDGDTIFVANGVYAETLVVDKAIHLIGSSMDSTVIDGRGLEPRTIHFLSDGYVENFNIYGKGENFSSSVIWGDQYLEVKNCRLSEAGGGVIILSNSSNVFNIIVTKIKQAYNSACLQGNCFSYISNSIIILTRENSEGFFLDYRGEYSITNNIIIFTGNNRTIEPGIFIHADRINISNNLISGFHPNIFVHLIIDTGFVTNNILTNSRNLQWPPATGGILTDANRVIVKNNILTNMTLAADIDQYVNWNYNLLWNNDFNIWNAQLGDSDIVADPMFVKDTIPDLNFNYDFHLQAYSPGIDKGDPNILDNDGSRSDIGMYGGPLGETYNYQDIAPRPPTGLSTLIDSSITIRWKKNTEADIGNYKLLRDTVVNFTVDSTKLITTQPDTFYTHQSPPGNHKYYYKLKAVDNQGNESELSLELFVNITSVESELVISDYKLYQNYPNPFNPNTVISYQLASRGYVKIMVYDIKGELIKVLVNESLEAGYYEAEFNGDNLSSGIYLYRIEVIGEGQIPVYSDMKKMILLK